MKIRVLVIVTTVVLALGLLVASLVLAQSAGQGQPDVEAKREAAMAVAAETAANAGVETAASDFQIVGPAVVTAPLFIGVSDSAISTYLVDPADGTSYPQFTGTSLWGAAYDSGGGRILFSSGATLHEWPLSGTPASLGNFTSSTSDAVLAMVALAYYDGTLYGTRNISSATDPEGIYEIDPLTLKATLVSTYDLGAAAVDIGGLDADPNSGTLYGTNDGSSARGLVEVGLDGSLTLVAPYPDGETDIDGLAISNDGRAFLITDAPGDIYVYDLNTMTYTTPISNPWTTDETFSGGAWVIVEGAAISLDKTVGTDPNVCATTDEINIPAAADVTYCYEVTNTGTVTLTRHNLDDSELGAILTDFPYTLVPGASAFLTQTATISATTINTATWTAYNPGPADLVTATASAAVTVGDPLTPEVEISPDDLNETIGENGQSSQTLTISNTGTADLEWAIEEAESDCNTPGDLPWLSVSPLLGTTAGSSSDAIEVAFDATGLAAGEYNGLLCIVTNDADEPTISVAITLAVVENRLYMPAAMGSPLGNP